MPDWLKFIFLLLGAICFALGALRKPGPAEWIALGLLFWVLVPLVAAGEALPG